MFAKVSFFYDGLKGLENYYGKPLYLSSVNKESELEINSNLYSFIQRTQPACLEKNESMGSELFEEECGSDLPVKTCNDNFIIIVESNKSIIEQKDNCVFISGPQENLTKITDEFLFNILGIR